MAAMVRILAVLVMLAAPLCAEIPACACDPADEASLKARQCSLTREALAQPDSPAVFFLKDANPNKPNRMLALPRKVHRRVHALADMSAAERLELWTEAIRKARELWGEGWGLAFNGDEMRTQCHPHIHIGKFLPAAERDGGILVDGPAAIPVPRDGTGLWLHPKDGKLHVHLGEELTETVLMR
jgi:diadenosine tetraphosphate (Ap4A) HIT family hydrolase